VERTTPLIPYLILVITHWGGCQCDSEHMIVTDYEKQKERIVFFNDRKADLRKQSRKVTTVKQ
jgi:hypothetical protein